MALLIHGSIHIEQDNTSRIWLVHDVWTTKGNRYAFIALIACYVDSAFCYRRVLLTLKLVAWNHYGALLARPVARYLIRHNLHEKMSSFLCNLFSAELIFHVSICSRSNHRLRLK